jgi:hypothetical protein
LPYHSGFFLLARFSHMSDASDKEFVLDLLRRKYVSTILPSLYSDGIDTGMVCISFAKTVMSYAMVDAPCRIDLNYHILFLCAWVALSYRRAFR